MNSTITRNYIDLLEVKEKSELCNCKCNLDVFRELNKEKEKKLDELDKKFMPYRFESKINILYCKDCDSLYLMKSHYEASSKIDFEDILCIEKMELGDLLIYFKLRGKPSLNDDYIKGIDIDDYYSIEIIKEERVGNLYYRTIVFSNDEELSNYVKILDSNKEK